MGLTIVQSKVAPVAERQNLSQMDLHHFPQHRVCRLSAGRRVLIPSGSVAHQLNSSVASLSRLVVEGVRWGGGMAPVDWKVVA
jgi:hypothetical protein